MVIKTLRNWLEAIRDYPTLKVDNKTLKADNKTLANELILISGNLEIVEKRLIELREKELIIQEEKRLENYWNNKRIKVNKQHKAREGVNMDVRCFFQRDCTLRKFTGTNDEIARKALGYVIARIRYKKDIGEHWKYAYETLHDKFGDCEDMGILVANILYNSGVPAFRIRLNKGYVTYKDSKTYHAWCTYLAEDNNWYVLDAAYWPRESVNLELRWKDAEKYLSCDASWSPEFSFGGLKK